jgi:hypothetical protein
MNLVASDEASAEQELLPIFGDMCHCYTIGKYSNRNKTLVRASAHWQPERAPSCVCGGSCSGWELQNSRRN